LKRVCKFWGSWQLGEGEEEKIRVVEEEGINLIENV
jgi:hypothetical protein